MNAEFLTRFSSEILFTNFSSSLWQGGSFQTAKHPPAYTLYMYYEVGFISDFTDTPLSFVPQYKFYENYFSLL